MNKIFLLGVLLVSPASLAARAPALPELKIFSLCGSFDPSTRTLLMPAGEKISFPEESPQPAEAGAFCFRGEKLRKHENEPSSWKFSSNSFAPVAKPLRYPVMVCAALEKKRPQTLWNGESLVFRGSNPSREKTNNWCGDGTELPVKEKGHWFFDVIQFREYPDPDKRSGMSIGNQ